MTGPTVMLGDSTQALVRDLYGSYTFGAYTSRSRFSTSPLRHLVRARGLENLPWMGKPKRSNLRALCGASVRAAIFTHLNAADRQCPQCAAAADFHREVAKS